MPRASGYLVPMLRRAAAVLLPLSLVLLASGCPRQLQAPEPIGGTTCVTEGDCNDGRTCGMLYECIASRCAATAHHAVPCPGEGEPAE